MLQKLGSSLAANAELCGLGNNDNGLGRCVLASDATHVYHYMDMLGESLEEQPPVTEEVRDTQSL